MRLGCFFQRVGCRQHVSAGVGHVVWLGSAFWRPFYLVARPFLSYAKLNGGQYDFLKGKTVSLNNDTISLPLTEDFWRFLYQNAEEWGCLNYQQDWMFTQQGMIPMLESATLCRTWQLQMDQGLMAHHMHFGYGGTSPTNW